MHLASSYSREKTLIFHQQLQLLYAARYPPAHVGQQDDLHRKRAGVLGRVVLSLQLHIDERAPVGLLKILEELGAMENDQTREWVGDGCASGWGVFDILSWKTS